MKNRWIALCLALTMAAALLAGCTQKADVPIQPEQNQTEQEPQQEETPQPQPEEETKPEEDQKPEETPEDQPDEEPEEELTPEQKRLQMIETCVDDAVIWKKSVEYDNTIIENAVKENLAQFLDENWEGETLAASSYLEADDGRINLYQVSLDEYICVLSHTDSFEEQYIRVDAEGASVFTPDMKLETANVSQEISKLVDGASFDKRYDGYYFDDQMDTERREAFLAYGAQALNGFRQTLEENKKSWKPILDDAFLVTVSFDENDQFVLELQGKTTYWLELRYVPGFGVWTDVSLLMEDDADWELDAGMLTDRYLLSLVTQSASGAADGEIARIAGKHVDGNTVQVTADYFAKSDESFANVLESKTYTITFTNGGYSVSPAE